MLLSDRYPIFASTDALLYRPYLADLRRAIGMLDAAGLVARPQLARSVLSQRLSILAHGMWKALKRVFHADLKRIEKLS